MRKLPTSQEYKNAFKNSENSLNKSFAIGISDKWYGLRVSQLFLKKRNELIKALKKLNTDAQKKLKNKLDWNPRYNYIHDFISIRYSETPEETVKALKNLLNISKQNLKNDMEYLKNDMELLKKKASLKKNSTCFRRH